MQTYELSVIAFTCLANWLDIFYVPCKKHVYLRAAVGKYREFAVNTEISKYFIFCQEKPFGETFSKITIKVCKGFSFSRKPPKKWNAVPRHIVAGLKPLNFTIFKALGKKGGWRKQVHLWQVSKASQLQYYLVKILQDNPFFTRSKSPEDSYLQHFHKQWNFAKL